MDRAERTGLGVAVIAHAVLFAALSLNLLKPPTLPQIENDPIEVSIVDRVALESSSPDPAEAPAPAATEPPSPELQQPETAPPLPPQPLSQPKPATKPLVAPKQAARPEPTKAKPSPAKPTRRPGLSRDLVTGLSDSSSVKPTQAGIGPSQMTGAQKASLNSLIYSQLRPFWKPPSGADAELLVTRLRVRLNRDGSLAAPPELANQTTNDSNRAQANLHAERAIQAVRRASPFKLPPEYYDAWRLLDTLNFDGRLSR